MNLEELKNEATSFKLHDFKSLSKKISELKGKGVSFLGCVAFVQIIKDISLKEARELTLTLDSYNDSERKVIDDMNKLMLSEFEEE